MNRWSELVLLWRQVTAHDGWVLRRASREALVRALAWLTPLWEGAGRAALRLDPHASAAHGALARRAERRSLPEQARRHRALALHAARNTLETSVLDTLLSTLRRGGARSANRGPAADSEAAALLRRAEGLLERGDATTARAIAECLVERDRGSAPAWRLLGAVRARLGERSAAREALERAADLDPRDPAVWLERARACDAPDSVRAAADRVLELDPLCDDALRLREGTGDVSATAPAPLRIETSGTELRSELGGVLRLAVRVALPAPGALYVLEPPGGGIGCTPRGRVALAAGEHDLEIAITALRPQSVRRGEPWPLHLALVSGPHMARARTTVAIPEREPGRIYHVITEDHELYDERERTTATDARTTLVDKSELAERIANAAGACWTHVVDVGSLALVEWAAARSLRHAWRDVADRCAEHLVTSVERGNDLGLHCHAFHDPETDAFCHGFDVDSDVITTDPAFLDRPGRERGFWSRAFPRIGDVDDRGSRAWATWRGIGRLEALGRLADPRFRVTLFRAGSFDFGDTGEERAASLALLQRLDLLADSDVPKPRLYARPLGQTTYPVEDDPARPARDVGRMRALELRAEYNVESDFLSDLGVLDIVLDRRIEGCRDRSGAVTPGTHVVCAMTHDKFINWRMGRRWDSLDPDYGDWVTIREHLSRATRRHPEVRFARPRDAVLDWMDHYSPHLLAWRDEEFAVLAAPGAEDEEFAHVIRLLGRGILVGPDRPRTVRVALPAWCHGRIRHAWIERDGATWPSRRLAGVPALEFDVDGRDCAWELRIRVEAGSGLVVDLRRETALYVSSPLAYRRASIEIPAAWSGTGRAERIRGIRLEAEGDRYRGRLERTAEPGAGRTAEQGAGGWKPVALSGADREGERAREEDGRA